MVVHNFAKIAEPLHRLTRKDTPFKREERAQGYLQVCTINSKQLEEGSSMIDSCWRKVPGRDHQHGQLYRRAADIKMLTDYLRRDMLLE